MSEKQTFRFGSKASAHNVLVQGPRPIRHPTTGDVIGHQKELMAEFGECEPEFVVRDINGDPLVDPGTGVAVGSTANIRGHYFDSRQQQEQKGWTDEEHDRVVAQVQRQAKLHPGLLWPIESPRAQEPFPGAAGLGWDKYVEIAVTLGVPGEALAYEKENANRSTVIKKLEAHIAAQAQEAHAQDALSA